MLKTELERGEYYDFVLTNDCVPYERNINDNLLFKIDVTQSLCDNLGAKLNENVLIENISLAGYDNFFIKPENSTPNTIINPEIQYQYVSGDTFCLHEVSGYTKNIKYDIEKNIDYNQLQGGFYQGAFKMFNYPVEFFPSRMRKGWSINMLIHLPINTVTGNTLNNVFNNEGFIFYLGTRAENKFIEFTDIEITKLKEEYQFEFKDTTNQYTRNYYTLNNEPYSGYFNLYDGKPYTGRSYDSSTSLPLTYNNKYKDIINNAFAIRIKPDGRIGYRYIYATDPCYTGETQDVININNNSFIDFTSDCDDFTLGKIITKYFTIEESYTKTPIINQIDDKYILLSVVFERDFIYDNKCDLKYGEYKKGSLNILINGFSIYKNYNFKEIIPHELDIESKYQEGVPFNISYGGGTQGLYDAVYLDDNKSVNGLLDKFFAGSFMGGVKLIDMYAIPLYVTEIIKIIKDNLQLYNLYLPKGGRRVFIKELNQTIIIDKFSIFATTDSISILNKLEFKQISKGDIKQITLAGEIDGFKQTFDIPIIYTLKGINYYNNITNQFEVEDKINDFDVTLFYRDSIEYKRYTHNKSDRGQVIIKLIF
jgi:hypothetical protein